MNAVVQQVIEHQVVEAAQRVETELDNELHRLEHLDEDGLDRLRQRRLLQLKQQAAKRAQWLARGHGAYDGLDSEKDFFAAIRGAERVVCHFFRENWPCKVMDKHLQQLAEQHLETRFVRIHAEKKSLSYREATDTHVANTCLNQERKDGRLHRGLR